MCVCWLVVHEGMTLMDAVETIQCRRGTILSNHGFRLQLVRLALRYNRLGEVEFAQKLGHSWVTFSHSYGYLKPNEE